MLKLRHLFDDRPLAERLAAEWHADPVPLAWFRISSNAVYPFTRTGEPCFLRFSPLTERNAGHVASELDFIRHLRRNGYDAAEPIPARDGGLVVLREGHVATAFRSVPGMQLGRTDLNDEIVTSYGRALAELHQFSAVYQPAGPRRWSHEGVLDWMQPWLDTPDARREADLVAAALSRLPRTEETYGLVHYDFECDNVLFDAATGHCHVIDFDDSMYHWFAIDIEQAVDSLREEVGESRAPSAEAAFLAGYAAVRRLPDELGRVRAIGRRFADLYWYTRVRRALEEVLPEEPDWMRDLRDRLGRGLATRAGVFGTPIG